MLPRSLVFVLLPAFCLTAAKHPQTGEGQGSDAVVAIDASVYADPDSVRQIVGNDLDGHYTVVRVKLTPRAGKVNIQLDDFLLRTDKDGERSHPFVASQIAGQGALIVSDANGGGGGKRAENRPTFGIGGMGGGMGVGNAPSIQGTKAKIDNSEQKNPVEGLLASKVLPEKETAEPVSGLLYFPMEKQKVKDLELFYTDSAGKLSVRFR